ncbi:MAG TPA: hypothetical protein VFV68_13905, partial [Agriterribacter sp.]|nr:hypothetical protein [Agriterribacter sp.]
MNEKLGNISYYDPQQENYFTKPFSEETGKLIDEEVRKLIEVAYKRTKALLLDKKRQVEIIAKELLTREVLFQSDLEHLIGKRPFEEKKPADVVHDHHHEDEHASNGAEGGISAGVPPAEIIPKP